MDPKANIDQQRALAVTLLGKIDTPTDQHDIAPSHERLDTDHAVQRLCQLVLALDQWRAEAGFDPYQVPPAAHQLDKARAWDAIDEALTRNAPASRTPRQPTCAPWASPSSSACAPRRATDERRDGGRR